jgi:hypothetical protein
VVGNRTYASELGRSRSYGKWRRIVTRNETSLSSKYMYHVQEQYEEGVKG